MRGLLGQSGWGGEHVRASSYGSTRDPDGGIVLGCRAGGGLMMFKVMPVSRGAARAAHRRRRTMEHSAQHPVDPPPRHPPSNGPGPPARRSRKLVAPLLATALVAVLAPVSASASAPVPAPQRAGGAQGPCLKGDDRDGWTATANKIDPKDSHHAFVGNGYLGQRVPPNGTGYAAPGGETGWPLKTPELRRLLRLRPVRQGPQGREGPAGHRRHPHLDHPRRRHRRRALRHLLLRHRTRPDLPLPPAALACAADSSVPR